MTPDSDSPLRRWSARKAQVAQEEAARTAVPVPADTPAEPPALTDADMPPLESLSGDSDYSAFFSPKVSAELRRLALRKLFHAPRFNIHDGLDDYCGDYTQFEPLGDIMTCDLQHQLDLAARRLLEQAVQEPTAPATAPAEPPTAEPPEPEQPA